ncbi:DUF2787 family protein [Shewanella insulae]|uniref:DUF2787 family protein n=1 Tax=Shewanella insulae TaxID=2681496 RepID=UPI002480F63F|nr:DUF2787 family protein [Shewanella insulae]
MNQFITRYTGLPLPRRFYKILEETLAKYDVAHSSGVTLSFRYEDYSAELGGYHPVEIRLDKEGDEWTLCYMTDFAWVGHPAELEKELDICFVSQLFYGSMIGRMPLSRVKSFARTFVDNFVEYHDSGVYSVKLSAD